MVTITEAYPNYTPPINATATTFLNHNFAIVEKFLCNSLEFWA
jgi:hypothetical protein